MFIKEKIQQVMNIDFLKRFSLKAKSLFDTLGTGLFVSQTTT